MVLPGSVRRSVSARAGRCVVRRSSAAHRLALYGLPTADAIATELDEHVEALASTGEPPCRIAASVAIATLRLCRYRLSDGVTTSLPAALVLITAAAGAAQVAVAPRGDGVPRWLYALIALSAFANGAQLAADPSRRPTSQSWRVNTATLGLLTLSMAAFLQPVASTDWGLRSSATLVGIGFLWIGVLGPRALTQASSLVALGAVGTGIGNVGVLALDFGLAQTVNALALAASMAVGVWASWRLRDLPGTAADAGANTRPTSPPISANHTFFVAVFEPPYKLTDTVPSRRHRHDGRARR